MYRYIPVYTCIYLYIPGYTGYTYIPCIYRYTRVYTGIYLYIPVEPGGVAFDSPLIRPRPGISAGWPGNPGGLLLTPHLFGSGPGFPRGGLETRGISIYRHPGIRWNSLNSIDFSHPLLPPYTYWLRFENPTDFDGILTDPMLFLAVARSKRVCVPFLPPARAGGKNGTQTLLLRATARKSMGSVRIPSQSVGFPERNQKV